MFKRSRSVSDVEQTATICKKQRPQVLPKPKGFCLQDMKDKKSLGRDNIKVCSSFRKTHLLLISYLIIWFRRRKI